jgi:hypothetical protein
MKLIHQSLLCTLAIAGGASAFMASKYPAWTVSAFTSSSRALSMCVTADVSGSSTGAVSSKPNLLSEGQVRALFYQWNGALATGDSRVVARRYAEDAVLLPTVVRCFLVRSRKWRVPPSFSSFLFPIACVSLVGRTTNRLWRNQELFWQLLKAKAAGKYHRGEN